MSISKSHQEPKPASEQDIEPASIELSPTSLSHIATEDNLKVLAAKVAAQESMSSAIAKELGEVLASRSLRRQCLIYYKALLNDFYAGDAERLHHALGWPVGTVPLDEDSTFWDHKAYAQVSELIVIFSEAKTHIAHEMDVALWMETAQDELGGVSPLQMYLDTGIDMFDIPYHETRVLMEFHPSPELTLDGKSKEPETWIEDLEMNIFWDLLWDAFNDEFSWIFKALGWPEGTHLKNPDTREYELTQEQRDDIRRLETFIKHAELHMMHGHEPRGYMYRLGQVGDWMVQENPALGGLSPSQVLAQKKDAGLSQLLATDFVEFAPSPVEPTDAELLFLSKGQTVISIIAQAATANVQSLPIVAGGLISAARGVKCRTRIINDVHAAMRYYTPKRSAEQLQNDNAAVLQDILQKPQPFRRNCLREMKRMTPDGYIWGKGDDE